MVESPYHPRNATAGSAYIRLIRSSAWYDLVVTIGFATPWTYALLHGAMNTAGEAFGLSPLHEVNPTQLLYANLMGSVVTVWALLRLIRPQRIHGLFDGMARLLFSTWFAYSLGHDGPGLLWALLVLEVPWGIAQLAPWLSRRFRRSQQHTGEHQRCATSMVVSGAIETRPCLDDLEREAETTIRTDLQSGADEPHRRIIQ